MAQQTRSPEATSGEPVVVTSPWRSLVLSYGAEGDAPEPDDKASELDRAFAHHMLLDGVNDSMDDLAALEEFCRGLKASVNLLAYNSVEGDPFAPSPFGTKAMWQFALCQHGIKARIIRSRGDDIAAACGQLKNKAAAGE